jgi:hypothetical protein
LRQIRQEALIFLEFFGFFFVFLEKKLTRFFREILLVGYAALKEDIYVRSHGIWDLTQIIRSIENTRRLSFSFSLLAVLEEFFVSFKPVL